MIVYTVCILYRHNDSHSCSHIQMEAQNAHSQCEGDLQMNQTPSWNNSASIKEVSAGVGQRSSLHLFLCLHCPSLFFSGDFSLVFFFFFDKIQSERILEANIHSFVWRLVKEKKDDELVCVCENKHACAAGLLLTADAELM